MTQDLTLTNVDCGTLILALVKCRLLDKAVRAGLACSLNMKNFGFPNMTDEEESELLMKLNALGDIAWLRETRGLDRS